MAIFAMAFTVLAQTNLPADAPLPTTTADYWRYAVAIITPLIVGGMKKLVPALPTWILPVSTPFVGMALGAALKALGASHMGWIDMAQAGALAVFVRESWNQLATKAIKGPEGMATKGPSA